MRWHIIGSNGYIASHLLPHIPKGNLAFGYDRISAANCYKLDLTNFSQMDCEQIHADDFVVILAAESSPDRCNNYFSEAYAVNVLGTENFVSECLRRGAKVLFFSSDVVVGATTTAHDETMSVAPFGNYAIMKHEVENVFQNNRNFKVFRLSYVFSKTDKFTRYLQSCAINNKTADVYKALYRNVIYLGDIIEAILALATSFDKWNNTIFHLSGRELLCREDMAMLYKCYISPNLNFTTSFPNKLFFAARPNIIETKSLYLRTLLGKEPTLLKDAMQMEFLR